MTEDSGRPGIWRSNAGVAEIEEPCTKRIVPWRPAPDSWARRRFRHKNSRTLSLPATLVVQCSVPTTSANFGRGDGGAACVSRSARSGVTTSAAAVAVKSSRRDTDGGTVTGLSWLITLASSEKVASERERRRNRGVGGAAN